MIAQLLAQPIGVHVFEGDLSLDDLDRGLACSLAHRHTGRHNAKRPEHVSLDLSFQMLAHAPDHSPRVQADSSQLPLADDSADVVLMINMLLFPDEVDRILRPGGHVVWVNSLGDQTPIHLPPADVAAALPGDWRGVTSYAGNGQWAVLRRVAVGV